MLNFLPSQYWPKFVQSLAKLRGWFMIEKYLISSLWHWDILILVDGAVGHIWPGPEELGIPALGFHLLLHELGYRNPNLPP